MSLGPLVGPPSVSNRLLGLVVKIPQTVRFIKLVGFTDESYNITQDFQFMKTNFILHKALAY